jgi:hypothetical protein
MAQNATFTLADAQSTPVNYTFTPSRYENGVQHYKADRANSGLSGSIAANPGMWPTISVSLREGYAGNNLTRAGRVKRKVTFKLTIPDAWGLFSDDSTVVDTAEATVTISVPLDLQTAAIEDIKKMVGEMVLVTPLVEIVDGQFPY